MTTLTQSLAQALINVQGVNIIIPNEYTEIESYAFNNKGIKSVVIPDSIITIGKGAFEGNLLTDLTIPSSVKYIHEEAFYGNSLTSLNLSEGLLTIGRYAFSYMDIEKLIIPNSVVNIGDSAFYGNKIEDLSIGDGLFALDGDVFHANPLSNGISAPQNPLFNLNLLPKHTSITQRTFTTIDSTHGVLTQSLAKSLIGEQGLHIVIPAIYNSIANNAFESTGLLSVSIPDTVTSIGSYAFARNALTSVSCQAELINWSRHFMTIKLLA